MMSTRDKKVVMQMIKLYKDMPCLWDKKHRYYLDRSHRYQAQNVLLNVYKQFEPRANIKMLCQKIHNLRTSYSKEYKKVKQSIEAGGGPEDVYIPTLYYYDALSFLGGGSSDTMSCCPTVDPLKSEKVCSPSVSSLSSDDDDDTSSSKRISISPKRKKFIKCMPLEDNDSKLSSDDDDTSSSKRLCISPKEKKFIRCMLEDNNKNIVAEDQLSTHTKQKGGNGEILPHRPPHWEVMGNLIGLELRDLEKNQLIITKKLISELIYYAQTGCLTHDSHIVLGP